ncbi:MAG: polysaccharide biosynthesis tyrosine autokinase [Pyrinomonadaceae bacterium]|nr:polysaccharide biosynthesis tyrosine autokinase [Pyrinomonadaceae bacterium]
MNDKPDPNQQQGLVPSQNTANDIPQRDTYPPSQGYGMDYGPEGEAHLRDYWRSVRRHLWLLLAITALVTTLVAIYMARKPDIYEARVRIQVDEDSNPALGAFKGSPVIVNKTYEDPGYINTQIQILSSASLLSRVVKALDLEHNQSFLRPPSQTRSTWQSMLRMVGIGRNTPEPQKSTPSDRLTFVDTSGPKTTADNLEEVNRLAPHVESLQQLLEVQQVKDTRLIEIHFTHPDPQVAAKVVNTIAEVYVLTNLEKKTETNYTTGDFLQRRIAELQSDIRTNEEKLINYAKSNQILSLDDSQNTVVDRLSGLNKQLLEAENERKSFEAAYRVSQEPGAMDAIAAANTKDLETKLADLKGRMTQLLADNTEEWPEVKEVAKQIAGLESQILEAHSRASSTESKLLETRFHQSLDRERALRKSFNEQRGTTLTQNEAAINYRIIQQEIGTNKGLLESLLQRSKENDVSAAGTQNNIHVVDYAATPKTAVGPRRLQVIVVALLLSLTFGVGLALFLEYLDDTVDTPDDVEKALRLPALAVIPLAEGMRRFFPGSPFGKNGNGNGNGHAIALLTGAEKHSSLAESYRQLRTSVLLSKAGRAPKTLLVTSSLPGEGKTTTAINMAYSLAQTEGTVLIVDADMRKPRMHAIFHLSNKVGLSTILSNELTDAEILNIVQREKDSGLYVLTCGSTPPNPAELLGSEQMRRMLTCMESTFTHIIIDSPPVAAFTDGVLLGTLVDGVLLVVHAGKSSREIARRGRQVLTDVGAKIIGVVLNKATLRPHDYYYYQSYYGQSYYKGADNEVEAAG